VEADRFPATRLSILAAVRGPDPEARRLAYGRLVESYWKPVYKYVRIQWKSAAEDAQDLTQGFFAHALEKGTFERFDAGRARFRTYLRVCLEGYVENERKAAGRLKRGGAHTIVPLDFENAEGELARHDVAGGIDPETFFEREWIRHLCGRAVDRLREESRASARPEAFEVFRRYDLEGPGAPSRPTYAEIASDLAIPETQVTNHLHAMRRRFREIVLEILREETVDDAEFREEARAILGVRSL
jgi:RNA polymerase sigma factor (sigma-70 family)